MKCPYCKSAESKVLDSRDSEGGFSVRRRRECLGCSRRFTTYERLEDVPCMVIKKDNRREPFDRNKLLNGLIKACEKRPISLYVLEGFVNQIEEKVQDLSGKEIKSSELGEMVMNWLYHLDEIAYVRFASVYRQFKDIEQFMRELREISNHRISENQVE
ncbi:MAG: transcriptional regulator NrdR [bacterium]|nr:transcriptional regulator NrdR [bacterium]